MRYIFLTSFLVYSLHLLGQSPVVPSKMEFAGIKLRIMDDARKQIQEDVDALTASPKYFEIKAERARTYFPIIERVFREEKLPDDFKYLSLQESALIPDAVSTSNAVGFWQFKDFTAVEVGLRVDRAIDERKNIVSSSRGAARYMHKNNQFFDNWLHALQAYQMGAGGAMKVLDKGHEGAKSMVVNKKTYWYVKKYLAHKVAFEGVMDKPAKIKVSEYYDGAGKTLNQIAKENDLEEAKLAEYNKWLPKGKIPNDRKYAVILPKPGLDVGIGGETVIAENVTNNEDSDTEVDYIFDNPNDFPVIDDLVEARAGKIVEINGLPGIVASRDDKIPALAAKAGVPLRKFLKYNDLGIDGVLIPGQVYYMKSKRGKAKTYYYVVQEGESLWSISQKFGLKLRKLKAKNRIKDEPTLKPGRVLWLRYVRPSNVQVEYKKLPTSPEVKEITPKEDIIPTKESTPILNEPEETALADTTWVTENVKEETFLDSTLVSDSNVGKEYETTLEENKNLDFTRKESAENNEDVSKKEKVIHEVSMGETYYAISKKYNVPVLDLLEWNNLSITDKLSIDQKLTIFTSQTKEPKNIKKVQNTRTHIVKEGETLYSISRQYEVTIQSIKEWNQKDDSSVKLGESLIIKKEN